MEMGAESRTNSQISAGPIIKFANTSDVPQALFNECSVLWQRLHRIHGFSDFFLGAPAQLDTSGLLDPVLQLWDIFSAGIPLCYLFNQLPEENGVGRIDVATVYPEGRKEDPNRACRYAIALFAMRIRSGDFQERIPGVKANITVTELLDRSSTSGFAKVVHAVSVILDHIPPSSYVHSTELHNAASTRTMDPKALLARSSVLRTSKKTMMSVLTREIVETERKYNNDLERILSLSRSLSRTNVLDGDLIFPRIAHLVQTQRQFLLLIEETAKLDSREQRWGRCFLECEDGFTEYYPAYCANYYDSTIKKQLEIAGQSPSLFGQVHKYEMGSMLARPLSRICKYTLLYESLLKAYSPLEYPHYDELKRGLEATKRVCEHVNNACQHRENEQLAINLESRIQDWQGCAPDSFGELLLDDGSLLVSNSDITQEYHLDDDFCLVSKSNICQQFEVFLFEQVIILADGELDSRAADGWQRTSPLVLKGYIFLEDVIRAVPTGTNSNRQFEYPLAIWWKDENDQEQSFVLRFKREDQMHQWQARINTITQLARSEMRSSSSTASHGSTDAAPSFNQYPMMRKIYSYIKPGQGTESKKPSSRSYLNFGGSHGSTTHLLASSSDHNSMKAMPTTTIYPINRLFDSTSTTPPSSIPMVKVKVKLREIFFTLRLPKTMEYAELQATVARKVTLGGIRREPVRMKYHDEDGDLVSIRSTEDVQIFFDQYIDHSGYPITLLVT